MPGGVDFSKLPKMVGWFNPGLLARALFHHLVAGIFGRFADQRVIQQLGDVDPNGEMNGAQSGTRHDYSQDATGNEPFWADFVSDLGDGFSSTYSVAYLLAADALRGSETPSRPKLRAVQGLSGGDVLPRGRLLVMGGDEVYPWPSREAYADRLQQPYELASPDDGVVGPAEAGSGEKQRTRDVFAIPGNHDWYDGLTTFDELFCRSRGQDGRDECNRIGGWHARQHRSYFAIKLPHNWWIWGADIQLSQSLDVGQQRYFRDIAEQMGPEDKFILCTAQPTWLQVNTPAEKKTRESLRQLIDPPLRKGAKICGIFSGDTHHYSRYNESDELGDFNLFIAGGGGAYVHGTHHLNDEIKMDWIGKKLSFRLDRRRKPVAGAKDATTTSSPSSGRAAYPSRWQSIRMAASNVLFSFRNVAFALSMGVVYWLVTWAVAEINVTRPLDAKNTGAAVTRVVEFYRSHTTDGFSCEAESGGANSTAATLLSSWSGSDRARNCYENWKDVLLTKAKERPNDVTAYGKEQNILPMPPSETEDVQPQLQPRAQQAQQSSGTLIQVREPVRLWIMAEYALFRSKMDAENLTFTDAKWWQALGPLTQRTLYMLLAGLALSPATAFLVAIVYLTFLGISASRWPGWLGGVAKWANGTLHFLLHVAAMWGLFGILVYLNRHVHAQWVFNCFYNHDSPLWGADTCPEKDLVYLGLPTFFWEQLVYPVQMILLGGLVAGSIFGIFLAANYILGRTNDDWAFSAQSSPNYRNFLRMKFEPNRLVVYPIGIDRPPRLRTRWSMSGWVAPKNPAPGMPLVEPRFAIQPRLIEGPIEINVNEVRNIPRNTASS